MSNITVKSGRLICVKNTEVPKLSNANSHYWAVHVEDCDGVNERCILLTEKELERAEYRASRNKEDLTKKGFLADLFD